MKTYISIFVLILNIFIVIWEKDTFSLPIYKKTKQTKNENSYGFLSVYIRRNGAGVFVENNFTAPKLFVNLNWLYVYVIVRKISRCRLSTRIATTSPIVLRRRSYNFKMYDGRVA